MTGDARHWDAAHESPGQRSWYEPVPERSLAMLEAGGLAAGARVIDVGGGSSGLVDALVARGCAVSVLDLSRSALEQARDRLGARAAEVEWIVADVTRWEPPAAAWDFWHDRAAFHFLTAAQAQARYRASLVHGLVPGGVAVIATFAEDGPERCSGLPVRRWSPQALAAFLGPELAIEASEQFLHETPAGAGQRFQISRFRRM